jgi:hypothetical protein
MKKREERVYRKVEGVGIDLEAKGLVERCGTAPDGAPLYRLTAAGHRVVDQLYQAQFTKKQ